MQFLSKYLQNLLQTREQILKDKKTFCIKYTEEISEILQEFLKKDMIITENVLTATLKDIGNVLNMIDAELAAGSQKEYSTTKSNYFYDKAGEDIEEWLTEIDQILEANNVIDGRRVAVVAAHLRDAAAD